MRLKNKAPTSYREGTLHFAPGETKEMSDHDGRELLNRFPWHFEIVKGDKPVKAKEVVQSKAPPIVPPLTPPADVSQAPLPSLPQEHQRSGRGYRSRE